ncbi:MAG: endolytic transglycosylase MltG [Candidatus Saccharimonadales bacterium]
MDENIRSIDQDRSKGFTIHRSRPKLMIAALVVAAVVAMAAIGVISFYAALLPVDGQANENIRIVIKQGQTASEIASTLQEHGLIRNKAAFELYTDLTGKNSQLRSGGYLLKKSHSVQDIVEHLSTGKTDELRVTILPGLTVEELSDPTVEGSLAQQGFTPQELEYALKKNYKSGLFKDRPTGTSLEGYIYPETYIIAADDTLDHVLSMTFAEFYKGITEKNIEEQLKAQGLTLYQGVVLASIVQKEVSDPSDQRQVAQVFLKRLKEGMNLGSDVTFFYAAKKEGRKPSVSDPSPYNTRIHAGLPPGPIANFHLSALQAVANPASGDFLYFVAGDDGKTYFARTEAEHMTNVASHCTKLCQ